MAVEFQLEGVDAIQRKLKSIKLEIARKAVRSSAGKAMGIVRTAARNNAKTIDDPTTGNNIAKNIALSTKAYPRKGYVVAKVGVRGGAKQTGKKSNIGAAGGSSFNPGGDTWYWRLVEFGTSHSKAQPFMRPAFENNYTKVADTFISDLNPAIDKAVAKAR